MGALDCLRLRCLPRRTPRARLLGDRGMPEEDRLVEGDEETGSSPKGNGSFPVRGLSRRQQALLEESTRKRIASLLDEVPGLTRAAICSKLGFARTTVEYHVECLVEEGIVTVKGEDSGRAQPCFLAWDAKLWDREAWRPLFREASKRAVSLYLLGEPGARTGDIADALGLDPDTVRHHLSGLRENGLIEKFHRSRPYRYYPTTALKEWDREVGEGHARSWKDE